MAQVETNATTAAAAGDGCPAQVIGGAAPAALAAPTNGLALMGLIYAFGSTSGAHLSECTHAQVM
jgi:hypothetical protein